MSVPVSEYRERTGRGNLEIAKMPEEQKKALIVEALQAKGLSQSDAAAVLNINRSYVAKLSKKAETGLLASLMPIAKRSIKKLAKGELVGSMKEIKGSDVLGACNAIADRGDVKINRQEIKSLHASIEITAEDRERLITNLGLLQAPQQVVIEGQYEQVTKIVTDK